MICPVLQGEAKQVIFLFFAHGIYRGPTVCTSQSEAAGTPPALERQRDPGSQGVALGRTVPETPRPGSSSSRNAARCLACSKNSADAFSSPRFTDPFTHSLRHQLFQQIVIGTCYTPRSVCSRTNAREPAEPETVSRGAACRGAPEGSGRGSGKS